jgi:RHS repeat-associated protein
MMKAAIRSLAVLIGFCLTALAVAAPVAFADDSSSLGGFGGSPAESPLVVPEAQGLLEGQGVSEAQEVQRNSPEAVAAREASLTAFEGLSAEQAGKLAGEVFPVQFDQPGGGPPKLPAGQRIMGYVSGEAALVDLGEGRRGVLDSTMPIAVASSGGWSPVDLGLSEVGGAFHVANLGVGVGIPKRLRDGVSLADSGVSLTPVDASGAAVGGSEGRVDGSVVFYGGVGVGSDVDEVVKPEAGGFSEDAVLRSGASPERLFYRVGLPEGGRLVASKAEPGTADVIVGGSVIASISVPLSQDAVGVVVPVSMTVEGDLLVVNVSMQGGAFQYPVLVDPSVKDEFFTGGSGHTTNWHFVPSPGGTAFTGAAGNKQWTIWVAGAHTEHEWGALEYTTQGESKIQQFAISNAIAKEAGSARVENLMEIVSSKEAVESKIVLPEGGSGEKKETVVGSAGNSAEVLSTSTHAGEGHAGELQIYNGWVSIWQEKGPEVSLDTTHEYVDGGRRNVFYGSGSWLGPNSGGFEFHGKDPGIGIREYSLEVGLGESFWKESKSLLEKECTGGFQCPEEVNRGYAYSSLMPNGEDNLQNLNVKSAMAGETLPTKKIKVDSEPPHGITLTELPSSHEIDDGQHVSLKASAIDGVTGTPSSGMASILLEVDGEPVSGPQGSCPLGPCTGHAEWTLSGENYAAGEHTLTVVATDNAGNVEKAEYHVTIHHAENVAVGPGSVDPVTGELSTAASDVSLGVPGGVLTVSRSYRSRHLAQGTEGPLGPQWNMSLGAQQSLYRVTGGMILTGGNGEQIVFGSKGGGEFTSPTGDAGLVLAEKTVESKTLFTLSDNGSVTTFEVPSGGSGVWMPASVEGPNGTNMTLYKFKVEGGIIKPKEELAPVPAGVSCGKEISELKEGCRALKFEYDEGATTAKGEKASEWGEVAGHLSKVKYIAWNASKTKTETAVAEYAYDVQGRLRAEWDPRVTPSPLKVTYGYDAEGHVTAVSTAGHEPALLEQGTIPGDASPGRLLAVAVPSAATSLGTGEAPVNTAVPTLSSTKPAVGTKISVNLTSEKTPGKWSASPLAFIYQWEDCNSSGAECTPIQGAVNEAYYPVASDEGHKLVVEAIALNATGAVTASSEATSTVTSGVPNTPLPEPPYVGSDAVTTLEYQVPVSGSGAPYEMSPTETAKWGQTDDPSGATGTMAVFPPDKVMGWPAKEYKRETVYYLDGKDRAVNTALPTGGISVTEYNSYNDIVRTLTPDNRLKAVTEGCKPGEECKSATESIYEEVGSEPGTRLLSTLGPQHTIKLAVGKEGKVNEEVLARDHMRYFYNEGAPSEGGPFHLVTETIDGAETASKEEFDKRITKTSYSGQEGLGWKLRKPTSVTTDPAGLKLTHTTVYDKATGNVTEARLPMLLDYTSQFGEKGTGNGQLGEPKDVALDPEGNVWVLDTANHRVQEFKPEGKFVRTFGYGVLDGKEELEVCTSSCRAGIAGSGNGQLNEPKGMAIDSKGNFWISDQANNNVQEFNKEYKFVLKVTTANGKAFSAPQGVATDSKNDVWIDDRPNDRIVELNESGGYITQFGTVGTGNGQFKEPIDVAIDSSNNVFVLDTGNSRVQKFNSKLEYVTQFGTVGSGNGQFKEPKGIAIDQAGNVWVADSFNARLEEFSPSGEYLGQSGSTGTGNGQFKEPRGIAVNSAGIMWVTDVTGNRVERFQQATAHNTKTIYYSKAANTEYSTCGEHPELANLPCVTKPATQPGTSGLPELPVTKYTYNIWDEPTTATETVGSTTRTKTNSYDAAGRLETQTITSTVGTSLPTVTYKYNSENGSLEKQSTPTKTITSLYNKLGQLTSYTDASEITSTYEYEKEKAARLLKINDGKGTETYAYSTTTGLPTEILYENGTTKLPFTAAYDSEGNMLTEGYPNGMTATYTYSQVDKPTALVYKKITHCTEEEKEKCVWFKDTVVPSIHGQWLEQTSTLSKQVYAYDTAGRLAQTQNTIGKNCTTRIYAYDEDTNRTSLTTREPGTEGKCATEGGKTETHTYDTADRLTDTGIKYSELGDITNLPAQNTEDPELTGTYYVNNQAATQTQAKQTIGYNLDPAGRTLETIATGEPTNSDLASHYAGPTNSPTWTENTVSKEWRRNIPGIDGNLAAIQNNGETPELQLTPLHGDIIAKAYLSETATELAAKADTSEYGVPTTSLPAKYSWLGAIELPTELPSGVINMGARSYVPQIGRFLQPDPISGGSADAYAYTFGDPVNSTDATGAYVEGAYLQTFNDTQNKEAVEREEAREAAARAAAEQAAREAAEAATAAAGPQYTGGEEEWEEWWEEEGEYEYAAYHPGGEGHEEAHMEQAVLYQPLSATGEGSGGWFRYVGCNRHEQSRCGNGENHRRRSGSRCAQYGGHWQGHTCVGVRAPGGGAGNTCRMIGGVTAPLAAASGPGGWVLWAIGFGSCWIPN